MKVLQIFLVSILFSNITFSQNENSLLQGEMTIDQEILNELRTGDTLLLMIGKKPFVGSIKLHTDNSIYEWSSCFLGQKKYTWCKIGTWIMNEKKLTLSMDCKTITLESINIAIEQGRQELVVLNIN